MSIKSLIAMSMVLMTAGCSNGHQEGYDSFDEYPVYESEWNEMVYSPDEDPVCFMGSYSSRSSSDVI